MTPILRLLAAAAVAVASLAYYAFTPAPNRAPSTLLLVLFFVGLALPAFLTVTGLRLPEWGRVRAWCLSLLASLLRPPDPAPPAALPADLDPSQAEDREPADSRPLFLTAAPPLHAQGGGDGPAPLSSLRPALGARFGGTFLPGSSARHAEKQMEKSRTACLITPADVSTLDSLRALFLRLNSSAGADMAGHPVALIIDSESVIYALRSFTWSAPPLEGAREDRHHLLEQIDGRDPTVAQFLDRQLRYVVRPSIFNLKQDALRLAISVRSVADRALFSKGLIKLQASLRLMILWYDDLELAESEVSKDVLTALSLLQVKRSVKVRMAQLHPGAANTTIFLASTAHHVQHLQALIDSLSALALTTDQELARERDRASEAAAGKAAHSLAAFIASGGEVDFSPQADPFAAAAYPPPRGPLPPPPPPSPPWSPPSSTPNPSEPRTSAPPSSLPSTRPRAPWLRPPLTRLVVRSRRSRSSRERGRSSYPTSPT